ncbi:MAG TPA: cytochrome P450 [Micromonosporaceae bacterium]|nr:cytochrome P450 [Micromonosporaceae bacterium]
MAEAVSTPIKLPTARSTIFDPPDELGRLREEQPVTPLAYVDGHVGWLVTSYSAARVVLDDPRFSARQELRHSPIPHPFAEEKPTPAQPGFFIRMDPPEHTRYRRLLTGQFTVRRMRQLEPRIQRFTDERLDAMEQAGPPVDLVQEFALPIPSLVICDLLGVPYADRERFQRDSETVLALNVDKEEIFKAIASIGGYLHQLVQTKRAEPADDMLSGLVQSGELTDEEVTNIAHLLLVAGYETSANMLALGTYALLRHPEQLAALRADPSLIDGAVEELLRYVTITQFGTMRVALEDVELDGQLVKAGETVLVSLPAANRDPAQFPDPDKLDLSRPPTGHLALGHGVHLCIGQELARIEMRIGYRALFDRFPQLRLAAEPEDIPMRHDRGIYGVHKLPVAW